MGESVLRYDSGIVSVLVGQHSRALLRDVRFLLSEGESVALIGETGSGKTMTALSIMGLLPANITVDGLKAEFAEGRPKLGVDLVYIPQNGSEFLNPARSIRRHFDDTFERISEPFPKTRFKRLNRREREVLALEKLRLAGFNDPTGLLDRYPFELSGGMAQRVTIALAACANPKLIIADEPTNGLDEKGRRDLMALLKDVFPKASKLVITHDFGVAELCDRVLVLCGGRLMEAGPAAEVLLHPQNPYTRALIGALVQNGMQQTPILRSFADSKNTETACPFYQRCPEAGEACLRDICHKGLCSDEKVPEENSPEGVFPEDFRHEDLGLEDPRAEGVHGR